MDSDHCFEVGGIKKRKRLKKRKERQRTSRKSDQDCDVQVTLHKDEPENDIDNDCKSDQLNEGDHDPISITWNHNPDHRVRQGQHCQDYKVL